MSPRVPRARNRFIPELATPKSPIADTAVSWRPTTPFIVVVDVSNRVPEAHRSGPPTGWNCSETAADQGRAADYSSGRARAALSMPAAAGGGG
jgi:hypothetical protein